MAMGGFKFAGRFCTRGSLPLAGVAGWALLMHRTRLAAFMAANERAGSEWVFDKDEGDTEFNEDFGNVIYSLDDTGNNWASFLRYGTANPVYLAILTCTRWAYTSGSVTTGYVNLYSALATAGSGSSSTVFGSSNTMFHRLSNVELSNSNVLESLRGALVLAPASWSINQLPGYAGVPAYTDNKCFDSASAMYCGYAIRGASVVSFVSRDATANAQAVSVLSGDGFASLYNPGDSNRLATVVTMSYAYASTANGELTPSGVSSSSSIHSGAVFALNSAGQCVNCAAQYTPSSRFTSTGSNIAFPYAGLDVFLNEPDPGTDCFGKGITNPELVSTNSVSNYPERLTTTANGALLYVTRSYDNADYTSNRFLSYGTSSASNRVRLFVGWDESNPDMTNESAWTEYAPDVEPVPGSPFDPSIIGPGDPTA